MPSTNAQSRKRILGRLLAGLALATIITLIGIHIARRFQGPRVPKHVREGIKLRETMQAARRAEREKKAQERRDSRTIALPATNRTHTKMATGEHLLNITSLKSGTATQAKDGAFLFTVSDKDASRKISLNLEKPGLPTGEVISFRIRFVGLIPEPTICFQLTPAPQDARASRTSLPSSRKAMLGDYCASSPDTDGFYPIRIPLAAFEGTEWDPERVTAVTFEWGAPGILVPGDFIMTVRDLVTSASQPGDETLRWPFDSGEARLRQEKAMSQLKAPASWTSERVQVEALTNDGIKPMDIVYYRNKVGMRMALVPSRGVVMASRTLDEEDLPLTELAPSEQEKYVAYPSAPIFMSAFEITNALFREFKSSHKPPTYKGHRLDNPNQPATNVSFEEAVDFCNWLSRKDGFEYRLPTISEWTFACGGQEAGMYPWKTRIDGKSCYNHADVNYPGPKPRRRPQRRGTEIAVDDDGHSAAAPVGQYPPNVFGLYDMMGNVSEICNNWGEVDSYVVPGVRRDIDLVPVQLYCGSSWARRGAITGSLWRQGWDGRDMSTGFRVVCTGRQNVPLLTTNHWLRTPGEANARQRAAEMTLNVPSDWSRDARTVSVAAADLSQDIEVNYYINSLGIRLVCIPPRTVHMGAERRDFGWGKELINYPKHKATVRQAFFFGATEVTQAQWQELMGNNPSVTKGDDVPVHNISWIDAVDFCQRLSRREGVEYRLPTEAEWELGCQNFYGNEEKELTYPKRIAWFYAKGRDFPHPAGLKSPNVWGAHDTLGNVKEWCQSLLMPYPYNAHDGRENLSTPGWRVRRGGNYNYDGVHNPIPCSIRSARNFAAPGAPSIGTGFRVVCTTAPWNPEETFPASKLRARETERVESARAKVVSTSVSTDWPYSAAEARRRQHEAQITLNLPDTWHEETHTDPANEDTSQLVESKYFMNSTGIRFAVIPPGVTQIGATGPDPSPFNLHQREYTEEALPAHVVVQEKPLLMSVAKINRKEWNNVFDKENTTPQRDELKVTWWGAVQFCQKLSEKEGVVYRLPTEAEWEYACLAGRRVEDVSARLFGIKMLDENDEYTRIPEIMLPNPWGITGMMAVEWEWCSSKFQPYPYDPENDRKAAAPGEESLRIMRVIRGGLIVGSDWWAGHPGRRGFGEADPIGWPDFAETHALRIVCTLEPFTP